MEKMIVQSVHEEKCFVDKLNDFVDKYKKLMCFIKGITEVIYKVMNI